MGIEGVELKLPALGRPVFLGQLYSASSEQFLNVKISEDEIMKNVQTIPNSFTSVKFKDINTVTDRADALDVSAELSIGVLAGLFEVKGAGRYVDTTKSNVASHEVSMVCATRTVLERIDVNSGTSLSRQAYDRAVRRGATHVVTGIVYGGTLVANVTDKATSSESHKKIQIEFSASLFKKLKALFSVEGKIAVDYDTTSKEVVKTREFELYGDYSSSEQPIPTTLGDIFEIATRWPKLVGRGVPCEIIATPLADLLDDSIEARVVHEIQSDDLAAIILVFDKVYHLAAQRERLQRALEAGLGQYCPSFLNNCRQRKTAIEKVLGQSRKALAKYLLAYRDGGVEKAGEAEEFLEGVREGYDDRLTECEADESTLGLLQDIAEMAADKQVPLVTVANLRSIMTQAANGVLGVVLTPMSPNLNDVVNTFDVLVPSIRQWRAEEDKKNASADGNQQQTALFSYYCDASLAEELLKLDCQSQVLSKALAGFGQSDSPRFVHYGVLLTGPQQRQFGWSLLNDEGWAFLSDEESSYYIGQVSGGERHGRGAITYADGSTYTGDWWWNARHGQGKLMEANKRSVGVFIDDQYRADGVVVNLVVVAHHSPVAAYKVPLRKGDATASHVRGIGKMLGWTDRDEYMLVVEEVTTGIQLLELRVVGTLLKQGQEEMSTASWPLETTSVCIRVEK